MTRDLEPAPSGTRTPEARSDAEALARELAARGARGARLAFVLGSGLAGLADRLEGATTIPAAELEHLPRSRVPGHAGRIVLGRLSGVPVLVQEGRVHLYEGRSVDEVTRSVRSFALLGVRGCVLTNAAGALRPEWEPGRFLRLEDHLDLQGAGPLRSRERGSARPYDPRLAEVLEHAARALGIACGAGIYAGVAGPSYETPAEVRMLRRLGADAVGMSTVAEVCAARAAGLRVAALSCLTNHAAGIARGALRHEDVLAIGRARAADLGRWLAHAAGELGRALET